MFSLPLLISMQQELYEVEDLHQSHVSLKLKSRNCDYLYSTMKKEK